MTTTRAARYGIAEWFGKPAAALSAEERSHFAKVAASSSMPRPPCPFSASLNPTAACNKKSGVCTIRRHSTHSDGSVRVSDQQLVTVCPNRFLEQALMLRWAGKVMLGTEHPLVVKEAPFLSKLPKEVVGDVVSDSDSGRKAGRIDWVLVHPDLTSPIRWCAVETQAMYFSGKSMGSEFLSWGTGASGTIPFPTEVRRPDYRSSGPKRLAPQLRVKVPELRNWGAKTCVIVDRYFYDQMSSLPSVKGTNPHDKLANAEVVWLVGQYADSTHLARGDVIYARLDESIQALNATASVGQAAFEQILHNAILDSKKLGIKVFKL